MKKSILLFAVALGILTACDPQKEEQDFNVTQIDANDLLANATFEQCDAVLDEDGNVTGYEPSETGNYIKYNIPGVNSISIFTLNADGSEKLLQNTVTESFTHTGGGIFTLKPRRNSDPHQTAYFRYVDQNGKSVIASKEFVVTVPPDIAYELKLLASDDYGEKVWTWDTSVSGTAWGNMGYLPGDGASVGTTGNGQWWGVTSEDEFKGQLQHSKDGKYWGDGSMEAQMIFDEDGNVRCLDEKGKEIRRGPFKIENYDPEAGWKIADLVTDNILWPWVINTGAKTPSECAWTQADGTKITAYEIVYLTPTQMTLVYPGGDTSGNVNGSWGEATYWHFKSESDLLGLLTGYEKGKSWTWDSSVTGAVWGNMGYKPGDGTSVGTTGNGQWWGVTSTDEFAGQPQHSAGGVMHGDGDLNAYMTFDKEGIVTCYAADNSVIRKGIFSLTAISSSSEEIKEAAKENGWDAEEIKKQTAELKKWKVGNLKTDNILWPWVINTGAKMPSEVEWGCHAYEVVYLTPTQMTLVYPGGNADTGEANGSWGEATFWHFKAKE